MDSGVQYNLYVTPGENATSLNELIETAKSIYEDGSLIEGNADQQSIQIVPSKEKSNVITDVQEG